MLSVLLYREQEKYLAPGRCFREAVQGRPAVGFCLLPPFLPYSAGIYEGSASLGDVLSVGRRDEHNCFYS